MTRRRDDSLASPGIKSADISSGDFSTDSENVLHFLPVFSVLCHIFFSSLFYIVCVWTHTYTLMCVHTSFTYISLFPNMLKVIISL